MSSFNVTNHVQRTLQRRQSSSSCSSSLSAASNKAGFAQQQQHQDGYDKAPIKGPAVSASSSSVSLKAPDKAPEKVPEKAAQKAPAKCENSSSCSSEGPVQPQQQAPVKGDEPVVHRGDKAHAAKANKKKNKKDKDCLPRTLNPSDYHKRMVDCISAADNYGPHKACYKSFREMARQLIASHGTERDYDNILYPLDLRHRKHRTERECNKINQDQQNQQAGSWVTVDRSPGGAVNLWGKAVYAETHGPKLKNTPDRRAGAELIRATCTVIEQADVNMADHKIRLQLNYRGLHRHLRHLDKKVHSRKDAKAAAKASAKSDGSKAPAKGFFAWLKRS